MEWFRLNYVHVFINIAKLDHTFSSEFLKVVNVFPHFSFIQFE